MERKNKAGTEVQQRLRQRFSLGILGGVVALLALVFVLQPKVEMPEKRVRQDLVRLLPDDPSRQIQLQTLRYQLAKAPVKKANEASNLLEELRIADALADIQAREATRKALPGYALSHWTKQKEILESRLDSLQKASR